MTNSQEENVKKILVTLILCFMFVGLSNAYIVKAGGTYTSILKPEQQDVDKKGGLGAYGQVMIGKSTKIFGEVSYSPLFKYNASANVDNIKNNVLITIAGLHKELGLAGFKIYFQLGAGVSKIKDDSKNYFTAAAGPGVTIPFSLVFGLDISAKYYVIETKGENIQFVNLATGIAF
jgi:hypothetical protein